MKKLLYIIVVLNLFYGCNNYKNKANNNKWKTSRYKTNLNELGKYINLSKVSIDTTQKSYWNVYKVGIDNSDVPGPSDYYIIASFKLNDLNFDSLNIINILKQPLKKDSQYYKKWLPKSVDFIFVNESKKCEIPVYDIEIFKKSPYLDGFFCVSRDLYVYLFMNTQ